MFGWVVGCGEGLVGYAGRWLEQAGRWLEQAGGWLEAGMDGMGVQAVSTAVGQAVSTMGGQAVSTTAQVGWAGVGGLAIRLAAGLEAQEWWHVDGGDGTWVVGSCVLFSVHVPYTTLAPQWISLLQ